MPVRHDLQATIRLLFYIYSSSLAWKQPLPPHLPSAARARYLLFKTFVSQSIGSHTPEVRRSKDFIRYGRCYQKSPSQNTDANKCRFYSWALALRSVSHEVDRLGKLFKNVFGELEDQNVTIHFCTLAFHLMLLMLDFHTHVTIRTWPSMKVR